LFNKLTKIEHEEYKSANALENENSHYDFMCEAVDQTVLLKNMINNTKKKCHQIIIKKRSKSTEIMSCECGRRLQRKSMTRHKKSTIHSKLLKLKEKEAITCECGKHIQRCNMADHKKSHSHSKRLKDKQIVTCKCGTLLQYGSMTRHKESKNHKQYLKKKKKKTKSTYK
jgi:hypothetical protein